LTHPDIATLVDPLCCAKRVKKERKIINSPSLRSREGVRG
jgi:hypothetical protein